MTVRLLTKGEALRFVDEHAQIFDAPSNPPNPFASSEWTRHFIEQIAQDDWTVMAVEAAGVDGSLMLLYRDGRTPTRCMALTNYYASLYSPLASLAHERAAQMSAMVQQLSALRPRIGTITLAPLDGQSPDTAALADALAAQGWYTRRYFCFGNWTLPCDGLRFDAYMAARDSQLRSTFFRKSKKFLAAGNLQIVTDPEGVDAAMDAFDAVYAKSWKQPEPYPHFVRGWAHRCAKRGWLRLGIARIDGTPIAAQLWFTIDRRASIYKLAYDEAQSQWSAGTVLTGHMVRHALDVDRVAEIDYLTGDDAYKKSWMTHRRERIGLMACNLRSFAGLAAASVEVAGQVTAPLRARASASTS